MSLKAILVQSKTRHGDWLNRKYCTGSKILGFTGRCNGRKISNSDYDDSEIVAKRSNIKLPDQTIVLPKLIILVARMEITPFFQRFFYWQVLSRFSRLSARFWRVFTVHEIELPIENQYGLPFSNLFQPIHDITDSIFRKRK